MSKIWLMKNQINKNMVGKVMEEVKIELKEAKSIKTHVEIVSQFVSKNETKGKRTLLQFGPLITYLSLILFICSFSRITCSYNISKYS